MRFRYVMLVAVLGAFLLTEPRTKLEIALEEFHEMMLDLTPKQRWKIHWLGNYKRFT